MKNVLRCAAVLLLILSLLPCAAPAAEAPQGVVRGDTMILRVPASWLKAEMEAGHFEGNAVFGVDEYELPLEKLDKIFAYARRYLGSGAMKFMKDCMDGEAKTAVGYWAIAYPSDYNRVMAQQYADDAWYTIVRLNGARTDLIHIDGSKYTLKMSKGLLHTDVPVYDCEDVAIDVLDDAGAKSVLSVDGIEVYKVFDQYLAVVTVPYRDEETLWSATMLYNGDRLDTVTNGKLTGYRNSDGDAVYCTLMTSDEVELLRFEPGYGIVYDPF